VIALSELYAPATPMHPFVNEIPEAVGRVLGGALRKTVLGVQHELDGDDSSKPCSAASSNASRLDLVRSRLPDRRSPSPAIRS